MVGTITATPPSSGAGVDTISTSFALAAVQPTFPDVSAQLTAANQSALTLILNSLTPVGTTPNVSYSADGSNFGPSVKGTLNAAVVTAPLASSNVPVPGGYSAAFITGGNAALVAGSGPNPIANSLFVGASSANTIAIYSEGGNTIIGGNGVNTIVDMHIQHSYDTILGGSGQNIIFAPGGLINSTGTDTIVNTGIGTAVMTITSAASASYIGNSGIADYIIASGSPTLSSFSGTIVDQSGAPIVFTTGPTDYTAGPGAATIIGGASSTTIRGSAAPTLFFGGGATTYIPGTAVDTLVGLNRDAFSATVGANGGLIFGGTSGNDNIVATSGAATYIGAGYANITLGGAANHLIGVTGANISASGASGSIAYFLGGGATTVNSGTGASAIIAGSGNETLNLGSGVNLAVIGNTLTQTSRAITVFNFDGAHDFINLRDYAANAQQTAFDTRTTSGTNVIVSLSDGTRITFQNPLNLARFSFT